MTSPVYIQIHNVIKRSIESGKWSIGDRIPSERELAVKFGVSRMTLRQAIQTLVDEGILERHVGSGTYVARRKVQEKMSGVTSFTELTKEQGKVPSSKTLSYHVTTPSLSEMEKLNLKEKDQVLRMERIRYADETPICFEVATIPAQLVKEFSKEEVTSSLYHALEESGYAIGHAQQTVTAMLASEKIADYLDIKRGDAILRLRQITNLKDGRPFEYVRTQYAGNRFEFYLEK
ncbi:GntR family transcriptional regulator [Liquorilactobacillus satsumensis]|uniref:GntR family transcriptional regulator n=1 Tax=Liquorilactobacillus satsumensis DSM 16230 = JCM 12392 TaxID=1423801 RepID=A0A0R1V3J8_9LACO|nr:GntR family transcriptional regulator [Liquorilactobacillus satsumensis]KRM00270.1 GntR family transcriptional regulator [Liquorilactobacillus satsumensis DSM 16230 = JCM 12392]MCC7665831.1 GntR family transcriptional regulator [Liquorilactobacillus satsumensis]MCP9313324.1 GntR family transcriptional regulator [Liquorilactobacillus satsumensis]MCP9328155.1 GntR family transcriptional regulator [Liquorilactobacillus satsumensis]MCP9356374.1 GntR family transcriptional regulator [Liquorilact